MLRNLGIRYIFRHTIFYFQQFINLVLITIANVEQQQKESALSTCNLDIYQDAVHYEFCSPLSAITKQRLLATAPSKSSRFNLKSWRTSKKI